MWHAGRKLVLAVVVTSGLVLDLTEVASAQFGNPFIFCLTVGGFSNVYRVTAFQVFADPEFPLIGRDPQFDERPLSGNAYVTPGTNTVNLGFTNYLSSNNTLEFLFRINLFTGSGPVSLRRADGTTVVGVGSFAACPAGSGPGEASGPDIAGE